MAGKLTWAELSKRPNRVETFISNFGGGSKFEFSNGDYVAIDKVIVGSGKGKVEYSPTDTTNLLSVMASARGSKSKLDLSLKVNGKGRAFGDLEKTEDYGGKPRAATTGSFGGTTTEVLSEVGFCFYYAMLMTGNLGPTYNVNVWKNVANVNEFKRLCKRYSGTTRMLSYTFRDSQAINKYIPLMYLFLTKEGWDGILRSQVIAFHNKYNLSKMYFISRGDGMPDYMNPYSTFSTIKGAMKESVNLVRPIGPDKWNPADVWVYSAKGIDELKRLNKQARKLVGMKAEEYTNGFMSKYNSELMKMYNQGTVIPISLKKSTGSVSIKKINMGNDANITQIVKYKPRSIKLEPSNRDVQLYFDVETYMNGRKQNSMTKHLFLKMKTTSFRLEIEEIGGSARHGSVGVGLQEWIIYGTARGGINKLEKIRKERKFNDINQFFPAGGRNWMGVLRYKDMGNPLVMIPYLNRLMAEINKTNPFKQRLNERLVEGSDAARNVVDKLGAAELAVAVHKIADRVARNMTVENLYGAAGSSGIRAGVSVAQMKKYKSVLGLNDDQLLNLANNSELAHELFEGGPHIKIS